MHEALSVHYWNIQTIQRKVNNNWILYTPGLGHYCHITVKVTQSCPTLCDPMDCTVPWNSPGQNTGVGSLSLLQGIFPAQGLNPGLAHCRWILYQLSHKRSPRILELVAYPFFSRSSRPRDRTGVSWTAGRFIRWYTYFSLDGIYIFDHGW